MNVIPNTDAWQVSTNFILSGTTLDQARSSCGRYQTAYDTLSRNGGDLSGDESLLLLTTFHRSAPSGRLFTI